MHLTLKMCLIFFGARPSQQPSKPTCNETYQKRITDQKMTGLFKVEQSNKECGTNRHQISGYLRVQRAILSHTTQRRLFQSFCSWKSFDCHSNWFFLKHDIAYLGWWSSLWIRLHRLPLSTFRDHKANTTVSGLFKRHTPIGHTEGHWFTSFHANASKHAWWIGLLRCGLPTSTDVRVKSQPGWLLSGETACSQTRKLIERMY